jgi:putative FmdB family regulatory protein
MPTYEYICSKCDHHFDLFQSITEQAITTCPREHCRMKQWGKGKVKRAIGGGAGLIFKGSGFYITDYRSDKYKEAAKKDAPAAAPASGGDAKGSSAKGESKPAASKPAKTSSSSE